MQGSNCIHEASQVLLDNDDVVRDTFSGLAGRTRSERSPHPFRKVHHTVAPLKAAKCHGAIHDLSGRHKVIGFWTFGFVPFLWSVSQYLYIYIELYNIVLFEEGEPKTSGHPNTKRGGLNGSPGAPDPVPRWTGCSSRTRGDPDACMCTGAVSFQPQTSMRKSRVFQAQSEIIRNPLSRVSSECIYFSSLIDPARSRLVPTLLDSFQGRSYACSPTPCHW